MIKHLFTWKGRIGRGEFAMTYIACWLYVYQARFSLDFFFFYFVGLIVLSVILGTVV